GALWKLVREVLQMRSRFSPVTIKQVDSGSSQSLELIRLRAGRLVKQVEFFCSLQGIVVARSVDQLIEEHARGLSLAGPRIALRETQHSASPVGASDPGAWLQQRDRRLVLVTLELAIDHSLASLRGQSALRMRYKQSSQILPFGSKISR